jgi:hypothetical protein
MATPGAFHGAEMNSGMKPYRHSFHDFCNGSHNVQLFSGRSSRSGLWVSVRFAFPSLPLVYNLTELIQKVITCSGRYFEWHLVP